MSRYRTPLRYPGGKQRIAPFLLELLKENDLVGGHYVEPYAGGAGAAMELLCAGHISHVHLNDSSLPIYAFWKSVIAFPDDLCARIAEAPLTIDFWRQCREMIKSPVGHDEIDIGFAAFYLNRCNRSGVLTGGVIGGLRQEGTWKIDARFNRDHLIARVQDIAKLSQSITLRNWDAEYFMREHVPSLPADTLIYCDPPYFDKHSKLYLDRYKAADHSRLAEFMCKGVNHRWLVSYDAHPSVIALYQDRRCLVYDLQYTAARVYKGREALIFSRDLLIPPATRLSMLCGAEWVKSTD